MVSFSLLLHPSPEQAKAIAAIVANAADANFLLYASLCGFCKIFGEFSNISDYHKMIILHCRRLFPEVSVTLEANLESYGDN